MARISGRESQLPPPPGQIVLHLNNLKCSSNKQPLKKKKRKSEALLRIRFYFFSQLFKYLKNKQIKNTDNE